MGLLELMKERIAVFDGSMGALLSQLGYTSNCPDAFGIEAPEVVRSIHERYIDAGADVIITDSLGSIPIKLKRSGVKYTAEQLISAAVENAKLASRGRALIALDIGSTGFFLKPVGDVGFNEMLESFKVSAFAGIGADFILLETQTDIAECRVAALAARETGLPVMASFTFDPNGRTMTGGAPECAALIMRAAGVSVMGINCSGGPEQMIEPLTAMRSVSPLPVVVQPNAGLPVSDGKGGVTYPHTPETMREAMRGILAAGASGVGGCCGTTPEHIRLIAELVRGVKPPVPVCDDAPMLCSSREYVRLDDALNSMAEVLDIDDLSEIDEKCALIELSGMSPSEAQGLTLEAQMYTSTPLCFRSNDVETLEAALKVYAGVAGVSGAADADVLALYGAKVIM